MFVLGRGSRGHLHRVHPELILVTGVAIVNTPIDFGVVDGLRTLEEQEANVKAGVSRTLDSLHRARDSRGLLNDDGEAWAIDIVPYVNGKMRWEWDPVVQVAQAVRDAARDLQVALRWGGVWDAPLFDLGPDLGAEVAAYVERRKKQGKIPLLDGPHFELVR